MPDDRISLRQLLALLFAALLAPAIGVLPSQTAALAGEAGWLSALAALPVLLGLCWVLFALLRPAGEGGGAGPGHRDRPGQGVGQGGTSSLFIVESASAQRQRQAFSPSVSCPPVTGTPPWGLFFADPAGAHPLAGCASRCGCWHGPERCSTWPWPSAWASPSSWAYSRWSPGTSFPCGRRIFRGVLSAAVPVLGLFGYVVFAAFLGGNVDSGERETAAVRYGGRPPSVWCLPPFSLSAWATSGPG